MIDPLLKKHGGSKYQIQIVSSVQRASHPRHFLLTRLNLVVRIYKSKLVGSGRSMSDCVAVRALQGSGMIQIDC